MRDGTTSDSHITGTGGHHAAPKEPISGPVPIQHRNRLGLNKGAAAGDNVQGAGNPSTIPTMNAGGKKTW
jgi:hypothetical protein